MTEKEILEKIASNIKIARMRKHLTQFQLAEKIDAHEKYICKIETGKQNITIKTLILISIALDIEISKLLNLSE